MVGLELGEQVAIAVAVDGDGRVVARAARAAAGNELREALEALGHVARISDLPLVGVAGAAPESETFRSLLGALAEKGFRAHPAGGVTSGAACAVGEAWIGAARESMDVVYLSAGEHTTAGIVIGGSPLAGAHGRAASAPWMALNPVEREDYRRSGCLEAEVAERGIVRRLVWRIKAGDSSRVQNDVHNNLSAITIDHLLDAARAGDGLSISVIRDTAKFLGMAAANLVLITDPQTLVLGGLMASAADLLFDQVKLEIARRVPESILRTLQVVPAALGADAAAIGAARLTATALA